MGKFAPDAFLQMPLEWVGGSCTYMTVCNGSPVVYTDARTVCALAGIAMTSGCFSIADGSSGRKTTVTAKTGASITASGSALAVCLLNLSTSTLLYVTTCTQQYLVSGGTVDVPSWEIQINDPT